MATLFDRVFARLGYQPIPTVEKAAAEREAFAQNPLSQAMSLQSGLRRSSGITMQTLRRMIPATVKIATGVFATKMIGLQENPVSAESVKFGRNFSLQWDKDNDPLLVQAKRLLQPYVRQVWRRP